MNLPTLLIASVVALIFVSIVVLEVRKKQQGKHSCGGVCGSCNACGQHGSCGSCHG